MKLPPQLTVAFSGNRNMISPQVHVGDDIEHIVRTHLIDLLNDCYDAGKRIFLSGGAVGFDMIAADEVLCLKERCSDVKLVLVIPFEGQESKFSEVEKARYLSLMERADHIVKISNVYNIGAYHMRNDFLVCNSSLLIAYNANREGGAASTVRRATKVGLHVINIFDLLSTRQPIKQLSFEFE
ncbi:MAG: SLOG family protein [Rikenellaceae bacterium]